jgi:hypothetical protein
VFEVFEVLIIAFMSMPLIWDDGHAQQVVVSVQLERGANLSPRSVLLLY